MKSLRKILETHSTEELNGVGLIIALSNAHGEEVRKRDPVNFPGREWDDEAVDKAEKETLDYALDSISYSTTQDGLSYESEEIKNNTAMITINGYQFDITVKKVKRY